MVPVIKAAFDLHIPNEPLLVDEYEVQQNTSPHQLFYHLEQEVIMNVLQESSRLILSCCVIPQQWGSR